MKNIVFYTTLFTIAGMLFLGKDVKAQQDTALIRIYNALKIEQNIDKMEALRIQMDSRPRVFGTELAFDAGAQYVAVGFAGSGNADKAIYWTSQVRDPAWKNTTIMAALRKLVDINKPAVTEKFMQSPVFKSNVYSLAEQFQINVHMGEILYQQGKYAQAMKYLKPAANGQGTGAQVYAMALMKSGKPDQIFADVNRIFIKQSRPAEDFKASVKKLYVEKFGSEKRFNAIVDSLSGDQDKQIVSQVAAMKVNEIAPDFELADINGKKVSLKSLRGKTVFVDFWATWCGPCVASFPGMQKAVDYYKDDNSVVFLFIHTYEKNNNVLSEAKKLLADRKLRFDNVLMDLKGEANDSPVAKSFNVNALPTKMVIDKDGVVKVRSMGMIVEETAVQEVKAMIELANKKS